MPNPIPLRLRQLERYVSKIMMIAAGLFGYIGTTLLLYGMVKDLVITAIIVNAVVWPIILLWRTRSKIIKNETAKPYKESTASMVLIFAFCGFSLSITSAPLALWIQQIFPEQAPPEIPSTTPTVAILALSLIFAPLAEEFLFRGYIYPILRTIASPWVSIVITTTLFATLHGNATQFALTIPLSIALGLVYERSKNIWFPVVMHAGFNLTAMFITSNIYPPAPALPLVISMTILIPIILTPLMAGLHKDSHQVQS